MPSFDFSELQTGATIGPGVLEWNELRFALKRTSGEVIFETETAAAHRALDIVDLFVDSEVVLNTPKGKIDLGKHRAAGAALRELVAKAAQTDREFRAKLDEQGRSGVRRGVRWMIGCAVPIALHTLWTTAGLPLPGGSLKDFTYFALTVPVIGLLASIVTLNTGFQLKRLLKEKN